MKARLRRSASSPLSILNEHALNYWQGSAALVQGSHAGSHIVDGSDVDGQVDLHGHETVCPLIHVGMVPAEPS